MMVDQMMVDQVLLWPTHDTDTHMGGSHEDWHRSKSFTPQEGSRRIEGIFDYYRISLRLLHRPRISQGRHPRSTRRRVCAIRLRGHQGFDLCEIHECRTRP